MSLHSIMQDHYSRGIHFSVGQVYAIGSAIRAAAPRANVLIFGCGNDSGLWSAINFDGHTVFLENEPVWIDKARDRWSSLIIEEVSYGDRTVESSLPIDEEALASHPIPPIMLERNWDVIVIDSPRGYKPSFPGRSLPIYWSFKVARAETQIFIDDYPRKLERAYADHFFRSRRPWSVEIPRHTAPGQPASTSLLWVFGIERLAQEAAMAKQLALSSKNTETLPDAQTSVSFTVASPTTHPVSRTDPGTTKTSHISVKANALVADLAPGTLRNVFVLCTGRCGSRTFIRACRHATNFSAGHESRMRRLGRDRFAYPLKHIEADNRLSWLLGRLDAAYGDSAAYVHLTRDEEATALSFLRRYNQNIMLAYHKGILTGTKEEPLRVCRDYVETINANIAVFLRDKSRVETVSLEYGKRDFQRFWEWIGAEGDLEAALAEWDINPNASRSNGEPKEVRVDETTPHQDRIATPPP